MSIYNINGRPIPVSDSDFLLNHSIDFYYDDEADTYYSLIRIFKKKRDGESQYPFVKIWENQTAKSALDVNANHNYPLVLNAGMWDGNLSPMGYVIQNGSLVHSNPVKFYPLTIDTNGDLGYDLPSNQMTSQELLNKGYVSCITAFGPLVVDYQFTNEFWQASQESYETKAQRQMIGQFGNGDYAIITSEGRSFNNSVGFDIPQIGEICVKHNLKFAYMLDGGGSAETVFNRKQINIIYENQTGRAVSSYIVFNGTNEFV